MPDVTHQNSWLRFHAEALSRSLGLTDPAALSPESLAMRHIREVVTRGLPKGSEAWDRVIAETTDAAFFDPGEGRQPLYLPVRIERILEERQSGQRTVEGNYTDLWYEPPTDIPPERRPPPGLLQRLADAQVSHRPGGVVLTARSGAGKTTAQRQAIYRALKTRGDGLVLPVYFPLAASESLGIDYTTDIPTLLARLSCGPDGKQVGVSAEYVRQALPYTPRLLICCDLNAVSTQVEREALAGTLEAFQGRYGQYGHRVVVTYRSVGIDSVLSRLLEGPSRSFDRYEQRPLDGGEAKKYFGLRHDYVKSCQLPAEQEGDGSLSSDSEELHALIDHYAGGQDPLISTPLLMHFLSTLSPEQMTNTRCVTSLYEHVVEDFFRREETGQAEVRPSWLRGTEGRRCAQVVLVRLALAMVERNQTSLPFAELQTVLRPDGRRRLPTWIPATRLRDAHSPWYENVGVAEPLAGRGRLQPTDKDVVAWLPVRRVGDSVQFVHDSLTYHFAAQALLCPEGPVTGSCTAIDHLQSLLPITTAKAEPTEDLLLPWSIQIAERLAAAPESWVQPARFLADALNSLRDTQTRQRLADPIIIELLAIEPQEVGLDEAGRSRQSALPRLLTTLANRLGPASLPLAVAWEDAVRINPIAMREHPGAALSSTYECLLTLEGQSAEAPLPHTLFKAAARRRRAWLGWKTLPGYQGGASLGRRPFQMRAPDEGDQIVGGSVIACPVFGPATEPSSFWLAVGTRQGRVYLWDPVADPLQGRLQPISPPTGSPVWSLCAWLDHGDGGLTLASGHYDGRVLIHRSDREGAWTTLGESERPVPTRSPVWSLDVWRDPECGALTLASGHHDGRVLVHRCDGEGAWATVVAAPAGSPALSLCAWCDLDGGGPTLASGHSDGRVRIHQGDDEGGWATLDASKWPASMGSAVRSLCVWSDPGGGGLTLATGHVDGRVLVHHRDPEGPWATLDKSMGPGSTGSLVFSLCAWLDLDGGGPTLVSGLDDGRVLVHQSNREGVWTTLDAPEGLASTGSAVLSLCAWRNPVDGGLTLASGYVDGRVLVNPCGLGRVGGALCGSEGLTSAESAVWSLCAWRDSKGGNLTLASGHDDGRVRVHQCDREGVWATLDAAKGPVPTSSLAFSLCVWRDPESGGFALASGHDDGRVLVHRCDREGAWKTLDTSKGLASTGSGAWSVCAWCDSDGGNLMLASGHDDGRVLVHQCGREGTWATLDASKRPAPTGSGVWPLCVWRGPAGGGVTLASRHEDGRVLMHESDGAGEKWTSWLATRDERRQCQQYLNQQSWLVFRDVSTNGLVQHPIGAGPGRRLHHLTRGLALSLNDRFGIPSDDGLLHVVTLGTTVQTYAIIDPDASAQAGSCRGADSLPAPERDFVDENR